MIPRGIEGVCHVATRITTHHVPKNEDGYTIADLMLMSELVKFIAQDFDRGADVLLADHADMIGILLEAKDHITDSTLNERIAKAVSLKSISNRISALSERGDFVTRVLIDLHEATEHALDRNEKWASQINDKIWRYLDAHAARHAYQSGF
tara:strand:- start:44178 stop:44630 length:453 start_codon:yes stop_codon:yes gene_type:complete